MVLESWITGSLGDLPHPAKLRAIMTADAQRCLVFITWCIVVLGFVGLQEKLHAASILSADTEP
jgi:hypothetical protein